MSLAALGGRSLDLCTLVWPQLDHEAAPLKANHARWLVGWNPRGLVVVAATFIDAPTYAEATTALQSKKDSLLHADAQSSDNDEIATATASLHAARGLRILGRIRDSTAVVKLSEAGDDDIMSSLRSVRQQADVWLDIITPGPTVAELFVCGYKVQRFHLHVVHCDPRTRQLQLSPVVLSVLAHYGEEGAKAIASSGGKERPHPNLQGISDFEGHMIPKHLLTLMTKNGPLAHNGVELFKAATAAPTLAGSQRSKAISPQVTPLKLFDEGRGLSTLSPPPTIVFNDNASDGGTTPLKSESPVDERSSLPRFVDENNQTNPKSLVSSAKPVVRKETTKKAPPRLDFPECADITELGCWLILCNAGCLIRTALRAGGKAKSSNQCTSTSIFPAMAALVLKFLMMLVPIVSLLARVFYIFRMLEYRQREFINWLALVTNQSTVCGLHPLMPHKVERGCSLQRTACQRGFLFRVMFDMLIGSLLALTLVQYEEAIQGGISSFAWYGLHGFHVSCVEWFHGWPAGFKMNDDLNIAISSFHMAVLRIWDETLTRVDFNWIPVSYQVVIVLAPLGASFTLTFIADCCNIVTQHLRLQFHLMDVVYRWFVALLSCLVSQFRGRKFNPLRKRTDSFDFSMDQMLLGTLLCTAVLFLIPTIALYYFYFALVRTSVWVVQESLMSCAIGCSNVPLYNVLFWAQHRHELPSGVTLEHPFVRPTDVVPSSPTVASLLRPSQGSSSHASVMPVASSAQGTTVDVALSINPMPLSTALFDYTILRWCLMRPFTVTRLLRFIVLSEEKPCLNPQMHVFPQLCQDPMHPVVPWVS